jgi:hypothetical protein
MNNDSRKDSGGNVTFYIVFWLLVLPPLLVLVAAGFVAAKMIPARVNVYDLQEQMDWHALRLGVRGTRYEHVAVDKILEWAREREIPLERGDVR